jgi:hypothetical protein
VAWLSNYFKTIPQEALRDLDGALDHFYRRVRQGHKPGLPGFKSCKQGIGSFRVVGSIAGNVCLQHLVTTPPAKAGGFLDYARCNHPR